jgi:hypothetical protein
MKPVPVIEIDGPDWVIDDLKTLDDCHNAQLVLTQALGVIEGHLIDPERQDDAVWLRKARMAMRMKKLALQLVQAKRGELRRTASKDWETRFVHYVRSKHFVIFQEASNAISNSE